jgi:hypothetical protein
VRDFGLKVNADNFLAIEDENFGFAFYSIHSGDKIKSRVPPRVIII